MKEKEVKKELKDLKKEIKKKKNPMAAVAAYYLAFKLGNEKEIKGLDKDASKLPDAEKIREAVSRYVNEQDTGALKELEGDVGRFWGKLDEMEIDEEFKSLFKQFPSLLFKAEMAKRFVPSLLERGEVDLALFFLTHVEKVKDPELAYLLGWAYDIKGIVNLAKDNFERAAKEGVEDAKRRLALLCVKQGEFGKAGKLYEELGDVEEAVECYLNAGDLKGCMKLLERVDDEKIRIMVASALVEKGKDKEALSVVESVDTPEAKVIKAKVLMKRDLEEAFRLAHDAFSEVRGKWRNWALEVLSEYYSEKGMWKELSVVLAPVEASGGLPAPLRLKLAEAYAKGADEAKALRILAALMDTELRREAKALVKEIKKSTESDEIKEVCATILSEDSFFKRLKEGLKKSKGTLLSRLDELIESKRFTDVESIEEALLAADVGVEATKEILNNLKRRIEIGEVKSGQGLIKVLEEKILRILKAAEGELKIEHKPTVIFVVGVNGTGKTTTIGKLGYMLKNQGYSVLFAAGDTFRAAAIEQLEMWGERVGVPVVKQKPGADPSGVVYDAVVSAKARGVDVVIVDTAGRLHTKVNLMEELKKMARVAAREVPGAPHETLLVLDAVVGQNALSQAKLFSEAVPVTGIVMTKLDGTAKGGIVVAIAKNFRIPIKFIGVGEKIDDLQKFDAERFVDALFDR